MRGRKPTPIEVRERNGNPQNRPIPEAVLVGGRPAPGDLAVPPPDLPPDAQVLWRRDVQKLVEVGLVDQVDTAALEGMCTAYARAKQAGRVLQHDGIFVPGSRGQLRPHPALKIEQESWDRFFRMAEHFALTPVARTRLGLAELNRRSLQAELQSNLGSVDIKPVT